MKHTLLTFYYPNLVKFGLPLPLWHLTHVPTTPILFSGIKIGDSLLYTIYTSYPGRASDFAIPRWTVEIHLSFQVWIEGFNDNRVLLGLVLEASA
jgi:hypothetical protein